MVPEKQFCLKANQLNNIRKTPGCGVAARKSEKLVIKFGETHALGKNFQ